MKLLEIKSKKAGTYIGVKLTKASNKKIAKFCRENNIPEPVERDNIHITLVYSRKVVPSAIDMIITTFNKPIEIEPLDKFHLWGDGKNTLVMECACQYLVDRHNFFKTQGATHDFDSYQPHITLSYSADDYEDKLKSLHWDLGPLELQGEYYEDLDLDWKENNVE